MEKSPNPIVNEKDMAELLQMDPIFQMIEQKYGIPPNWSRPTGFVTLSKIILEQQVSLASAHAHFIKLNSYLKEFTPSEILLLSDEEMRTCQISRQKASYLRALSTTILNGELVLEALETQSEAENRQQLTKIKGIGNWTCDIYFMFCLQEKDIFPIGDIAVVNTIKELSKAQTREEILQLSETWRPFRSLAVYFLWYYYLMKRNRPVEFYQ